MFNPDKRQAEQILLIPVGFYTKKDIEISYIQEDGNGKYLMINGILRQMAPIFLSIDNLINALIVSALLFQEGCCKHGNFGIKN